MGADGPEKAAWGVRATSGRGRGGERQGRGGRARVGGGAVGTEGNSGCREATETSSQAGLSHGEWAGRWSHLLLQPPPGGPFLQGQNRSQ